MRVKLTSIVRVKVATGRITVSIASAFSTSTVSILLLFLNLFEEFSVIPLGCHISWHVLKHLATGDAAAFWQLVCADVIVD